MACICKARLRSELIRQPETKGEHLEKDTSSRSYRLYDEELLVVKARSYFAGRFSTLLVSQNITRYIYSFFTVKNLDRFYDFRSYRYEEYKQFTWWIR